METVVCMVPAEYVVFFRCLVTHYCIPYMNFTRVLDDTHDGQNPAPLEMILMMLRIMINIVYDLL